MSGARCARNQVAACREHIHCSHIGVYRFETVQALIQSDRIAMRAVFDQLARETRYTYVLLAQEQCCGRRTEFCEAGQRDGLLAFDRVPGMVEVHGFERTGHY